MNNPNEKKKKKKAVRILIAAAALAWLLSSLFIVNETETAVLTRFSKPLDTVCGPGLHIKLPFPLDGIIRFDKRLTVLDHEPTEFLTLDKKNILIDTFALWKINDEHKFLTTVRQRDRAEARLLDMITAVTGEVIGSYPLKNFINTEIGEVRLPEIDSRIFLPCRVFALENFGIEIVDIRINSFNFPEQNRQSVIKRMQAERYQIATRYRSEGEEEALKISAETDFEVRKLMAEANKTAELIKGQAEADSIRIYGEAFSEDPGFFEFLRTLEAYEKIADSNTTFIMKSESRLWNMLERGRP